MKLKIAPNQTEVHKANGTIVLLSYKEPVAAFDAEGSQYIRSEEKQCGATTWHINKWLSGLKAEVVPQWQIDALL